MECTFEEIWFSILEHLDAGPTSRFIKIVKSAFEEEVEVENKRIEQMMAEQPDYQWEQEVRDITFGELWEARQMAGAFVLVALYQRFETAAAHCLEEIFSKRQNESPGFTDARKNDEKIRTQSVFKRLRAVVSDMDQLPGFAEIEELRHIVNAWKHEGFVSASLANKTGNGVAQWEEGRPLDDLDDHYERLREGTTDFSRALGSRLHSYWKLLPPLA